MQKSKSLINAEAKLAKSQKELLDVKTKAAAKVGKLKINIAKTKETVQNLKAKAKAKPKPAKKKKSVAKKAAKVTTKKKTKQPKKK